MSKHFPFPLRGNNNLDLYSLAISSQASISPDFVGSWFDRLLRQGSGQLPLTGSPQNQGFFASSGITNESVGGLLARSPGRSVQVWAEPSYLPAPYIAFPLLAGVSFPISSPAQPFLTRAKRVFLAVVLLALVSYFQNMNQGRDLGAGFSALVNWLIWPSRNVIRSFLLARSARSCFTSSPSLAIASVSLARAGFCGVSTMSGISITHLLPTLLPCSNPLANLRLTVLDETPRAIAASFIEYFMPKSVTHGGLPKRSFGDDLIPKLPMLSKCNHG
jgi:hypothetical protein